MTSNMKLSGLKNGVSIRPSDPSTSSGFVPSLSRDEIPPRLSAASRPRFWGGGTNGEKAETLAKAIWEIENFFLHEKEGVLYDALIDFIEKPLIENLLVKTGGNQLKAAKILGINRNTLHAKIKKLGIDVKDYK